MQQCKFAFLAVRGTSAGQEVGLSEVRLFDAYGDVLDVISAATNPGGATGGDSYVASNVIDKSTSTRWQDKMGVPSTLLLTLSSSSAVLGYDFFSSLDSNSRDPKTWQVVCRSGTSGAWATMHTKTDVTSPSARRASYVIGASPNGQATYAWAASSSSFPAFASALSTRSVQSVATPVATSCKFVIWAVSGTSAGEQARSHPRRHSSFVCPLLNGAILPDPPTTNCASRLTCASQVSLSEVEFYDDPGGEADDQISSTSITSASNPGVSTTSSFAQSNGPSKAYDSSTSTRWADDMGVPSTIVFNFNAAQAVASYKVGVAGRSLLRSTTVYQGTRHPFRSSSQTAPAPTTTPPRGASTARVALTARGCSSTRIPGSPRPAIDRYAPSVRSSAVKSTH